MRPLKLAIKGLRSYRQHQEIDFSDKGLLAILGDTGAGKSSILEAICVALYASSSWEKRSVKALISSGLDTLDVELTFLADGKLWRVLRSIPAGTYPPATHQLVGLTDGSRLDGVQGGERTHRGSGGARLRRVPACGAAAAGEVSGAAAGHRRRARVDPQGHLPPRPPRTDARQRDLAARPPRAGAPERWKRDDRFSFPTPPRPPRRRRRATRTRRTWWASSTPR